MNNKQGGPGGNQETAAVIEEREMLKLLKLPEGAFTEGSLVYVEPEAWKNVGASLVHAIRILKND